MKSNIAHFDEQIKDTIGSITNNLAFTTGQRVNLEWHQSNDGHNVYMDGRIDGRNAVLPFPSSHVFSYLSYCRRCSIFFVIDFNVI